MEVPFAFAVDDGPESTSIASASPPPPTLFRFACLPAPAPVASPGTDAGVAASAALASVARDGECAWS